MTEDKPKHYRKDYLQRCVFFIGALLIIFSILPLATLDYEDYGILMAITGFCIQVTVFIHKMIFGDV